MTERFFPVGATYAPLPKATEVDIAEWPRDIGNIAKLGLTVFRLFLCWDRVEREPGVRDFSRIDRAFDLAEKHGLKVIGNVEKNGHRRRPLYDPAGDLSAAPPCLRPALHAAEAEAGFAGGAAVQPLQALL